MVEFFVVVSAHAQSNAYLVEAAGSASAALLLQEVESAVIPA